MNGSTKFRAVSQFPQGSDETTAEDVSSRYNRGMRDARQILDQTYLEMRWRCLSLAADFDRIERATGGADVIANDPRLANLREAMKMIGDQSVSRAEFLQMILSDK